ncbi:MAG TPA: hypothetical protein DIT13_04810 [Verrucomicrobiales bacterium]|nr:hypothetical protein [Verrucomicrobiales bacterium]HRJ08335.1 PQQ-binding-like beta-propeller repeat protein [Prosthecobacter sp.]HRK14342.1 PQQ-binding-like beta-propeller repeat protein [Prosthecobacter sp.]
MHRLIGLFLAASTIHAADWPVWRYDAGRTAFSPQAMPENPALLWSRELPPLRPAYKDPRLQFDGGYEPVCAGGRLILGSSREDCVMAYDAETGAELWRVLAGGPVRCAPVIVDDLVIFGADDGVVRCVRVEDGAQVWTKRAVPSGRMLLGNQRLISAWPVRGGPVAEDGRVYFAAGVWPLEGVFVFCWDAATGDEIWCNDRCSYLYGIHPHDTQAMGGLAPQGYLLVDGGDLVVPCSNAYPARLDLKTGALKQFELPSAGRLTGGWFASTPAEKKAFRLQRWGLLIDSGVNAKRHEDKPRAEGIAGIRRSLHAAGREAGFDSLKLPGLAGRVHSAIVADEKCFVVTEDGILHAYGTLQGEARHWKREISVQTAGEALAKKCLAAAGTERGYALMIGPNEPGLIESLILNSHLHLIILATDAAAHYRLNEAGLYGERASVVDIHAVAQPGALPPYFADVIFALEGGQEDFLHTLRPGSGRVIGPGASVIHARGPLEGASDYFADWQPSQDALVRAPLGVLWFDDALSHFKRSPQPKIIGGVMITSDKDWLDASNRKGKVDYRLQAPVFSDIYTGRVLDEYEAPELRAKHGTVDMESIQPAQYRPPTQKDDWKPGAPQPGMRISPLTGLEEPRVFPKSYGCDGGFDYGGIYTFRSGTAAFYDKKIESGTIHISGPRSGCTNSVVPAGGILNVPYYYEGCTCSYPLPVALALTSMDERFEQWATWGSQSKDELRGKIERIGINLGAPGDRNTRDGTLWLDHPNVGGPSPEIEVENEPALPEIFYRHSIWVEGGEGWPWVAASGMKNLRRLTLRGLKPGSYLVRLTFACPDGEARVLRVSVQGRIVSERLELPRPMTARTQTHPAIPIRDGSLTLELEALEGGTLLSGIEVIREGLGIGNVPENARAPGRL